MKLIEIINWVNTNRLKILIFGLFFFIGIHLYAALHESLHYFSSSFMGYTPTIIWSLLKPRVEFFGETSFAQFFFIAFLPYFFSLIFLSALFIIHTQHNASKFLAVIAIFPFIDITINVLGIFVPGNDFSGIFLRAASIWQILFAVFMIFILMGITVYFGQYFFRKVLDIV